MDDLGLADSSSPRWVSSSSNPSSNPSSLILAPVSTVIAVDESLLVVVLFSDSVLKLDALSFLNRSAAFPSMFSVSCLSWTS